MAEDKTSRKVIGIRIGDRIYVIGNPVARLKAALYQLMARLRSKPEPPGYPYADKFAPVRRGPKGRSGAAVVELDDECPHR